MERQLAAIKEALEMGAKIEVKFHNNKSLKQAKANASHIANMLDLQEELVELDEPEKLFQWYQTDNPKSQVNVVSYYSVNKEVSASK